MLHIVFDVSIIFITHQQVGSWMIYV